MSKNEMKALEKMMETYRMYLDEIIRLNELTHKQLIKAITLYEEQVSVVRKAVNNE